MSSPEIYGSKDDLKNHNSEHVVKESEKLKSEVAKKLFAEADKLLEQYRLQRQKTPATVEENLRSSTKQGESDHLTIPPIKELE